MVDIVERLLRWSNFGYGYEASRDMKEAATEIARLRAELRKYVCDCPKYTCQYFPCGEMARAALETPTAPQAPTEGRP